jgi:hypothetical protein
MSDIDDIVCRCQLLFAQVTHALREYQAAYSGKFSPWVPVDALHPESFHLDDRSPWEEKVVSGKNGKWQKLFYLQIPTGICRDYFVSPVAHWIYIFKTKYQWPVTDLIELAMCAGLQSSYLQFWIVCEKIEALQHHQDNKRPAALFHEISDELFGKVVGSSAGRFVTCGITSETFQKYFLDNSSQLDNTIILIQDLLEWLDVQDETVDWQEVKTKVKAVNTNALEGGEMGEFRLLVICQALTLAGVCVERAKGSLNQFIYPVHKSREVLQSIDKDPANWDTIMQLLSMELQFEKFKRNVIETLLCESLRGRRDMVFDHFFKGMHLFRYDDEGKPTMKRYGKVVWEPVVKAMFV